MNTPEAVAPISVASRLKAIFIGRAGIRAGWRLLLFFIFFALVSVAVYIALGTVLRVAFHLDLRRIAMGGTHGVLTPALLALSEGPSLIAALAAAAAMARIERRPMGAYGLPLTFSTIVRLAEGAGIGVVLLVLIELALLAGGAVHIALVPHAPGELVRDALAWTLPFLLVGLSEEFFVRGYPLFTLRTGLGFWPAALITSLAFAALHIPNPGETPAGLFGTFAFAFALCYVLRCTGTLWFGIGFHAAWDWSETYLVGVPDSGLTTTHTLLVSTFAGPTWLTGGSAGPEGSIVTWLGLILTVLYVRRRFGPGTPQRAPANDAPMTAT